MHGQNEDPLGVSYAMFNNASFADVAMTAYAMFEQDVESVFITTRQVASRTGRSDSVVKPVMTRLAAAEMLMPMPKSGPSNGPQFYARRNPARWVALVALVISMRRTDGAGSTSDADRANS